MPTSPKPSDGHDAADPDDEAGARLIGEIVGEHTAYMDGLEVAKKGLPQQFERQVADSLRRIREEQGLSQAAVVNALKRDFDVDMHQTTLAKLEAGKRPLRLLEVFAISGVYGLNVMTLLLLDSNSTDTPGDAEMNARIAELEQSDAEATKSLHTILDATLGQVAAIRSQRDDLIRVRRLQAAKRARERRSHG